MPKDLFAKFGLDPDDCPDDWDDEDLAEMLDLPVKKDHTKVEVSKIPDCDFCENGTPAFCDGKIVMGSSWASMCLKHFRLYGVGLGPGVGQEYILAT